MSEKKWAVCEQCGREMVPGGGCEASHIEIGGKVYERVKVGAAGDFYHGIKPEDFCTDCNAGLGKYHHAGCDCERCPACGGQLLGCDCDVA